MLSVLSLNFKHLKISSHAVHMVSFENFVKLVSPSLSELKVPPSFCFAFKIPDDMTASNKKLHLLCHTIVLEFFPPSRTPEVNRADLNSPHLSLKNHSGHNFLQLVSDANSRHV